MTLLCYLRFYKNTKLIKLQELLSLFFLVECMYILEGRVVFEPASRWLSDNNREIRLSVSASRCLETLILFQGKPVTRNELIERVWSQNGAFVTESSVRQTLHLLRKILNEFSLSKDLIQTSRRQGYCIDITQVTTMSTSLVDKVLKLPRSKKAYILLTAMPITYALGYILFISFFNA